MATSTQWQLAREAAERYQRTAVPAILGPAARALVDWCPMQSGDTVIDIGCGTGAAARCAAERVGASGRVVAVDVSAGMIDVARSLPPVKGATIEWHVKGAYELPLADNSVDVSLSAQTLQFVNDKPLALREMRRVLRSSGHVALSLWCDIRESPYFHVLAEVLASHIGQETAAGLKAGFGLSSADEIRALLLQAGFNRIETTVAQLDLGLLDLRDFVPSHLSATPMAADFNAASERAQQAIVQEVAERLAPYDTDAGVRIPFRTHLVMASK